MMSAKQKEGWMSDPKKLVGAYSSDTKKFVLFEEDLTTELARGEMPASKFGGVILWRGRAFVLNPGAWRAELAPHYETNVIRVADEDLKIAPIARVKEGVKK
jgi:hypothetical protein